MNRTEQNIPELIDLTIVRLKSGSEGTQGAKTNHHQDWSRLV